MFLVSAYPPGMLHGGVKLAGFYSELSAFHPFEIVICVRSVTRLLMNYVFAFALGIGFAAGLRSLTPPAVVTWAAYFGWLNLRNSPLGFMGSTIAVAIFSLLAVFELINDKRPSTPKRTAPVPLIARILMGGLCGACLCAASNLSMTIGAILGAIGGVIGAFAGYEIRRRLVRALNIKDIFIALLEDLVTIGLACLLVTR